MTYTQKLEVQCLILTQGSKHPKLVENSVFSDKFIFYVLAGATCHPIQLRLRLCVINYRVRGRKVTAYLTFLAGIFNENHFFSLDNYTCVFLWRIEINCIKIWQC
jgi:hypothetical protein